MAPLRQKLNSFWQSLLRIFSFNAADFTSEISCIRGSLEILLQSLPEFPLRMMMLLAAVSPMLGGRGHRSQELVLQPIVDILHKQLRKGKRVSGQPVTFRQALLNENQGEYEGGRK